MTHQMALVESTRSQHCFCFFEDLEEFVSTNFPEGLPSGQVRLVDEFGGFLSYSPNNTKGVALKGARPMRSPSFKDRSW